MKPPKWMKVGARVIARYKETEWDDRAPGCVRRITCVESGRSESGWWAAADGGDPCPECGRTPGVPTPMLDGAWFQPAKEAK